MKNPKRLTSNFRALQKAHDTYEELRQNLTKDLAEVCKSLPFSESEVCRRVGISRSAWSTYKEKGIPYEKIAKLLDFLKGVRVDNKAVIL